MDTHFKSFLGGGSVDGKFTQPRSVMSGIRFHILSLIRFSITSILVRELYFQI